MFWEQLITTSFLAGLFASGIRLGTPLLLTALGDTISQRAGVLNIGLEGLMIIGALAGFLGGYFAGTPWIGVLCAMLAGALLSSVHGLLCARLGADQIISGLALNVLGLGLAILVFRGVFGITLIEEPQSPHFSLINIPLLSDIPFFGTVLFKQHIWVYISWILVPLCYFILFKTSWGLTVTAVGENPLAADSAGINVQRTRFLAVVIGGAFAGLGGMCLALTQLGVFKEAMVSGRGFIAIAIVMFGRWNPFGVLLGALVFGIADALQLRFQAIGVDKFIPSQFLISLPYILTILVVVLSKGKKFIPASLAIPYRGSEQR